MLLLGAFLSNHPSDVLPILGHSSTCPCKAQGFPGSPALSTLNPNVFWGVDGCTRGGGTPDGPSAILHYHIPLFTDLVTPLSFQAQL